MTNTLGYGTLRISLATSLARKCLVNADENDKHSSLKMHVIYSVRLIVLKYLALVYFFKTSLLKPVLLRRIFLFNDQHILLLPRQSYF